jgi:RNA polymerase primary sigma factor
MLRLANHSLAPLRKSSPIRSNGHPSAEPRRQERAFCDGDIAITLYLCEIAKVKRLTPQAEIELAVRIKKGDKKAREELIKANLPLVVKIARGFEGNGLPLLDLVSEGNLGLMEAIGRFDPATGTRIATYSSRWIKQSINRALANRSKSSCECHNGI